MVHPVKIKPVQSAVQDKAPTTSEVAQGELAVNVHASSLAIYTLDGSGAVAVLADGNRQANIATTNAATAQATADLAVTAVTGTAPIVSTGGLTPALSITAATTSAAGTMSSADKVILDAVSTTYVALAGSTMTGALTLSGDPTLAMNASTKQYTDANDFWTRTGTILSPETAGDGVSIGGALVVTDDLTVNTDALFVDASDKKMGIGTAIPSANLEIKPGTGNGTLLIDHATGSTSDGALNIEVGSSGVLYETRKTGGLDHIWYAAGVEQMRLDSSGVVKIGGTLPSSPNITLTGSTGAATFAGSVIAGASGVSSGTAYYRWQPLNGITVNNPSASAVVFQTYDGASADFTSTITAGGNATFAGNLDIGSRDTAASDKSGAVLVNDGTFLLQKVATDSDAAAFLKFGRGKETGGGAGEGVKCQILADGSATFAGGSGVAGGSTLNVGNGTANFIVNDGYGTGTLAGSAFLMKDSGGTTKATILSSSGEATFAGKVQVGSYPYWGAGTGAYINGANGIIVCCNSTGTTNLWNGFQNAGAQTSTITAAGAATFAGLMKSSSAQVEVASTATNNLYGGNSYFGGTGDSSGNANASILNTGAATFAGKVNIGDGSSSNQALRVYETDNEWTAKFQNDHASTPYGILISYGAANPNATAYDYIYCNAISGGSTTSHFRVMSNGNAANTNNSWGSISDEKLKQDIVDASSQWDDIKAVKVRNFKFKVNPTETLLGVVAQEIETVSPGLVEDTTDYDAEGKVTGETTKTVKYSILYMKAIKALQEAIAKIETLEAKVAALEAA